LITTGGSTRIHSRWLLSIILRERPYFRVDHLGDPSPEEELRLQRTASSEHDSGTIARAITGMSDQSLAWVILRWVFQLRSSAFLSAGNLTNLFIQSTPFILLGMAEIWLLLLGDMTSVGWVTAVGAAIGSLLMDTQFHWKWYLALPVLLLHDCNRCLAGLITIVLKAPSFIGLGGSLFWEGVASI